MYVCKYVQYMEVNKTSAYICNLYQYNRYTYVTINPEMNASKYLPIDQNKTKPLSYDMALRYLYDLCKSVLVLLIITLYAAIASSASLEGAEVFLGTI